MIRPLTAALAAAALALPALVAPAAAARNVIDLTVLWTPERAKANGGDRQIASNIRISQRIANEAYAKTFTRSVFSIRRLGRTSYNGAPQNTFNDLKRGAVRDANVWRDQSGSDIVCLVASLAGNRIGEATNSGKNKVMVVERLKQRTFAHELGHLHSCFHGYGSNRSGGDANGYSFTGKSGVRWATIMSNNGGRQLLQLSSPGFFHDGVRAGVFGQRDNSKRAASTSRSLSNNRVRRQ